MRARIPHRSRGTEIRFAAWTAAALNGLAESA